LAAGFFESEEEPFDDPDPDDSPFLASPELPELPEPESPEPEPEPDESEPFDPLDDPDSEFRESDDSLPDDRFEELRLSVL
jgi:hypothetical protein